jgi:hypothetical protein
MPRSSISSSDPRPVVRDIERRWRTFAIVVLTLLVAAEVALRFPEVRSVLPPRTHYYHPAIAQRIDALERVMRLYHRVDVLFIGSSIVVTNVHPLVFDSVLGRRPNELVSFNAGLYGLWPTSVHLYAEHVWLPLTRPRVVVQGVRYPEIAATTHAKNETQVWSGRIERSWREAGLLTRLHAAVVSRVTLLQYHGALTRLLQRLRHGRIGAVSDEDDEYDVRGYAPRGAPPTESIDSWEADLPNDGTCTADRCAVGFAALRRAIVAVRARGAEYVLVNVPEHAARWRGADGVERYRHYVESLRRFAAAERVGFIDPTDGDPFRFAATPYSDLAHMTAAGSRQFTRELAGRMAPIVETALARQRALYAASQEPITSGDRRAASREQLP